MKVYKVLFFLIVLFSATFYSHFAFGQKKEENIYVQALSFHLKKLKKFDENALVPNSYFYLEKSSTIPSDFPDTLENLKIIIVDDIQIEHLVKKKKGIFLIRINPIQFDIDKFNLSIVDFSVMIKKKNFFYTNTGGSNMEIKYNCDNKSFDIVMQ